MEGFKQFVLNSTLESVAAYCSTKAVELACAEKDIGMKAIDVAGTFYCPDDDLAAQFGFLTESALTDDCAEMAVASGVRTSDVIDALHHEFSQSRFNEGFYGGQITFVDRRALAERFPLVE